MNFLSFFEPLNFVLKYPMTKITTIGGWMILTLLTACNSGNRHPNSNATTNQPQAGPANDELLETLQGKWQSLQDSTYTIEFLGNKMRHFNEGKLSSEMEVEVNIDCNNAACATTPGAEADGWCFTEKDPYGAQCNVVTKCNRESLQYQPVGSAGGPLLFKRL